MTTQNVDEECLEKFCGHLISHLDPGILFLLCVFAVCEIANDFSDEPESSIVHQFNVAKQKIFIAEV